MPKTIRFVQWPLLTVLHKTIIELTSYFIVNRKKSSLFCTMQYKRNPSLQSKFNLVTFFYSVLSQKVLHGYVETRWNVCIHPFFEWQRFKPRKDKKARISRTLNQGIVIFYRFPSFPIFFVTMQTFDEKFCCISRFCIPNNFYILNHFSFCVQLL